MASTQKAAPPPPETIESDTATVACDGGGGALGHPRVFIDVAGHGEGKCPYCGTVYRLVGAPRAGSH